MAELSAPDRILIEARQNSLQLEKLAVQDLASNLGEYLEPSWTARKLLEGYRKYVAVGNSDLDHYHLMRRAFTETRGKCNRVFGDVLSSHIGPYKHDCSKTMFGKANDWDAFIRRGAALLARDGFLETKLKVPARLVESLASKVLAKFEAAHGADTLKLTLKGSSGGLPQIKSSSLWLSTFDEIYQIAADPVLLSIAQAYLGVPPIFNTPVAFLNSSVQLKDDRELSGLAQLYHHDMDRLRFVKLFIYLTDVDESAGPHAVVRGTHLRRPERLWEDGRHSDDAVLNEGGLAKDEVKIMGKAGTVFMVDTSALHKGLHPTSKARLMAQVQYVSTLFGKPLASADHKVTQSGTTTNQDIVDSAELVRRYAGSVGVRFMQNYI